MKKLFKTLTVNCAILPLAFAGVTPALAKEAAPTAVTQKAKPALWVVKDDDTTIYLFGTIHVLKPGLSWFDGAVKNAFDKSDELTLEIIMPEDQAEAAALTMPLALDKSGTPLSSRLTPEDLKAYQAALTALDVPIGQFEAFKPWFAAVTLSMLPLMKQGFDPEQGAEKQLTRFAKASGKQISSLETVTQQLGFFDSVPMDAQVRYLNSAVKEVDKVGPQLDRLVTLWAKGESKPLADAINESFASTPDLTKVLLWDRNERWADQIKARLDKPGTVFIAVGAGHLAGEKSVQDYLKERGLKATRVE